MSFENGRQTPSRTRINAILQRLGLPDDRYYALVTPEELEIEALEKEIVACNALKHVNEGFDKTFPPPERDYLSLLCKWIGTR